VIWFKRRLSGDDYVPYMDRLQKLLFADALNYPEYLMVSTKTDDRLTHDYYIGVPDGTLAYWFRWF
jgi:hypothetical protein